MKDTKDIIAHLKDKGFVYAGSSIYGGLANSWDFGPLGTMLKNNIKEQWKKTFVDLESKAEVYHFDSGIILNPKTWVASGHVGKFNDPMIDCKSCKERFRADHLIEEHLNQNADNLSFEEQTNLIHSNITCPSCSSKDWTEVRAFELMFKTSGSKTGEDDDLYLRPETAQGVFINFKNVVNTLNAKVPFGIGQIGKAFRNEVTPGNFIFRTKEFEQLELEFFTKDENESEWFDHYLNKVKSFLLSLGLSNENIKEYEVPADSLAHYSSRTVDFEFNFSFGWGELLGIANRGGYDLSTHSEHSNESLEYNDQALGQKYMPSVIETSMGVERLLFAIVSEALITEQVEDGEREVLKLPFSLAPYKAAIMPLTNKLENEARELYEQLLSDDLYPITFVKGGSIGKRYRKQDSIGTPFSITFDFDSIEDKKVTIRHRDTMEQERIDISEIKNYILLNAKR